MADYIFIRKSRNVLSSVMHVVLNLLLAGASVGATILTGNYLIGLILVVVSKWRIFAVNHRYWLLNLRSSLVDLIVGASFVLLAYAAGTTVLPVHIVLIAGYAIWLILLKPRSSETFTIIQALVAIILGSTTATIFTAVTDPAVLIISCFIIGYAASNHFLVQNSEDDPAYISMACGLVFAEIGWISHAWLILYTLGTTGICISQLSIVLAVLAYAYFQICSISAKARGRLKFSQIALPVIFSLLVIIVLVVGFSQPRFNIH